MTQSVQRPDPQSLPYRPRYQAIAALYHRDFRLYWLGGFVSLAGTQMQQAAVAWQVYSISHSPVALGLLGLVRVVPLVVLSLYGGVIADARDRRRLLLVTESALLLTSLVLAGITLTGTIKLWMVYGLVALAAAAGAFDNPARQALVPSLVPQERLGNALSLNSTVWELAVIVGPSVAGVLMAGSGVGIVYIIDAFSYIAVLVALLAIRSRVPATTSDGISIRAAVEGLRFMRATPIITQLMLMDFVATFFGSASALLPIFARDILHVGAQGYGLLYSAPALGAVVSGVALAFGGHRIRRQGIVILAAVAAYAACTIVFGISRTFVLSLLALAGTGAADTVSMILRQTVRQSRTPDVLRGRMSSVNMVFVMGGPQLGELEAGLVARSIGAPGSVLLGGAGAIIGVIAIGSVAKTLRSLRES